MGERDDGQFVLEGWRLKPSLERVIYKCRKIYDARALLFTWQVFVPSISNDRRVFEQYIINSNVALRD